MTSEENKLLDKIEDIEDAIKTEKRFLKLLRRYEDFGLTLTLGGIVAQTFLTWGYFWISIVIGGITFFTALCFHIDVRLSDIYDVEYVKEQYSLHKVAVKTRVQPYASQLKKAQRAYRDYLEKSSQ